MSVTLKLWDYGWLDHDTVQLSPAASDQDLLSQYISSTHFRTSFVPGGSGDIHGPFKASGIWVNDFEALKADDLEAYLQSIELSEKPGEDEAQRRKLWGELQKPFQSKLRCYALKPNERSKERFHDWGFVLLIFRELLFVGPQRDRLERYVVGYD